MSTVNISDFQNAARQVMTDAKNAVDSMEQTHSSMTAPTRNRFSLAPALTTPLFWSRPQHQPSKLASIQFLASASQHRQPQTTTSLATQPENTHGQHQQEDTSSESDELHRHRRAQRDKPDQSAQILRTHGLRFIKENLRTPVSDPSNKVEQQEVVLTISFALRKGDIRGSNMIVKILGSQTLEDLADAVPCLCDFLTVGDDVPTNRTAFFLMDNAFYGRSIDGDTPNAMPYIQAIDKFMKSNHTQFGTKPTSVQNMTCRLADLILEQGRRYLYMHQGDCSHVFVVQNVSLFNPNRDCCDATKYPFHRMYTAFGPIKCNACGVNRSRIAVYDDELVSVSPSLWCIDCHNEFFEPSEISQKSAHRQAYFIEFDDDGIKQMFAKMGSK